MTSLVQLNDQSIVDGTTTVYLNASDNNSIGTVRMNGTDFQFHNGTDWKTVSTT